MDDTATEIRDLQGCIDDLISLEALPTLWTGRESPRIAATLLEKLAGMLQVDFAYARVGNSHGSPVEAVHVPRWRPPGSGAGEVGRALERWLGSEKPPYPMTIPNPVGDGDVTIAALRLGIRGDTGVLVVGSRRVGFPTAIETVLMRAAANRAAIAFQDADVATLERRAADELERRVSERTAQLSRSNEELRRREAELQTLHEQLAAELEAMARLHEVSKWLVVDTELQPLLEQILDATMALQKADFGNVQLLNPATKTLEIAARRGFGSDLSHHFAALAGVEGSSIGRAVVRRKRIVVTDVQTDPEFAPHREIAAAAGFRAAQTTPLINRAGRLLGVISTQFRRPHRPAARELRFSDLYARQAAEMIEFKSAAAERRKLAALVENSTDFIGIASLGGACQFLNAAGRRIVGLGSDDDVSTKTLLDYVHGTDRARFEQQVMPTLERLGRWEGEIRFRHLETDMPIPMLHHVFYIREGERPLGLATISRDFTERKRTDEALRKALEELVHVTRVVSLDELSASIAHEVNQPLAAVITNGEACLRWLTREVPDLAEARSAAERIISDGRRAGAVIGRIRALSGKTMPKYVRLQVNDVIREALALAHSRVLSHEVSLQLDLAAALPQILGDRVQLQQVLLNLMINGMEAMPLGNGRRELRVRSERRSGDEVLVAVRDSGVGLDAQTESRLFDPFFTTKPEGMGLGLSISRRIIGEHGGRLWATPNRPDDGTTLTIALPAAPDVG